jgi:hypothetical protein
MTITLTRLALACAVLLAPAALAQGSTATAPVVGTATISGRVLDVASGTPLSGAVVYLPDLRRGAVTDESGGFVLEQMPEGEFRWRIQRLGYATWEADSPVQDGDWFTVRLLARPEVLAGITVVADAFEVRRSRVSTSVQVAERSDIIRAAARNGAEVLESVGGVDVVRCSGMSFATSPTTRPGRNPLSLGRSMGGGGGSPITGRAAPAEENPVNVTTGRPIMAPASDENCLLVNGQMLQPTVFLDEEPSSVALLATVSPAELHLVEVYARGEYVYVYTQGYVEQLARSGRRPRALARF